MFSRRLSLLHRCPTALLLILAFSIYCAAARQPEALIQSALELTDPLGSAWVLSDLDGDQQADVVVSRDIGRSGDNDLYRVELKLSRAEGSGSFTFATTDTLGVNVTAVDVDGDRDLDLVITDSFSGQRIGIWINDGKGIFTQDFLRLYSAADDRVLNSSRLHLPSQAIDENASRRLPARFRHARFLRAVLFSFRAECRTAVQCKLHFQKGPQHLRAPPSPFWILVLI
jgi:FG-GAP-like repeat